MKVETSPDWLPPGWTREFRFQKTGRQITQYVNLASGQRFFTKDDLLRYTKMESKRCDYKVPTLRKNVTSSANDQAVVNVTAVKENKRLDWLPKDWLVEVKTRKSGLTFGRRDKYYTDPVSGYVFRSKTTVLRYLETGEIAETAFLPKKDNDGRFLTNADESQLPAAKRKKVKHLADGWELAIGGETSDRRNLPDLDTETFEKGQSNDDYDENETEKKSIMDSKISCESTNKKVLDLPQGLSNQLDQLDSKQVASSLEHVKPCQSEAIGSCVLDDKSHLRLNVHSNPEVAKQAYASTIKSHCGLTEKIIKPIEEEDNLGKQPQKLEAEKTGDSKSEVQALLSSEQCQELTMKTLKGGVQPHEDAADEGLVSTPASSVLQEKNRRKTRMESKRINVETKNSSKFKKMKEHDTTHRFSTPLAVLEQEQVANEVQHFFCSDPCLEFAIKTLTGAIPLEDAISEGLVKTSIANVQQQKSLIETRTEHSSCKKTLFSSVGYENKDAGLQQGSSKQLVGHATELVAKSLSNEQILDFAAGKIYDSKTIRYVDLTVKSSSKSKEPHKNQTVPAQTNDKNPGKPSAIPFGSSWSDWSDSFFESPFKILASSSLAENTFSFQSNFHQSFGGYGKFAPPTGQSVQQQQFPLNPPSLSLPKSSTTAAKKSYRKGKKKLPDKVARS